MVHLHFRFFLNQFFVCSRDYQSTGVGLFILRRCLSVFASELFIHPPVFHDVIVEVEVQGSRPSESLGFVPLVCSCCGPWPQKASLFIERDKKKTLLLFVHKAKMHYSFFLLLSTIKFFEKMQYCTGHTVYIFLYPLICFVCRHSLCMVYCWHIKMLVHNAVVHHCTTKCVSACVCL